MKKLLYLLLAATSVAAYAQDFDKQMATARTAHASGDLENSRFALEQALHELDVVIGKKILELLPTKLGSLAYNEKDDNVTGGSGVASGLFVHRSYGNPENAAALDIINNSPLITSLNAILSIPFVGNSADGSQKVVKVQGYKAVLNKKENEATGKTGYTLQVPLNNTLFTLDMDNTSEQEIQTIAHGIPLSKISQMAQ